jgi:hypothetical protein
MEYNYILPFREGKMPTLLKYIPVIEALIKNVYFKVQIAFFC